MTQNPDLCLKLFRTLQSADLCFHVGLLDRFSLSCRHAQIASLEPLQRLLYRLSWQIRHTTTTTLVVSTRYYIPWRRVCKSRPDIRGQVIALIDAEGIAVSSIVLIKLLQLRLCFSHHLLHLCFDSLSSCNFHNQAIVCCEEVLVHRS